MPLTALVIALILGVVAGLRSLMAPAVVLLARGDLIAGLIVGVLGVGELIGDLLPNVPSRTSPMPLIARLISGGFVGWFVMTGATEAHVAGAVVGVVGALIGTYGGHALRLRAITAIGAIPAALTEDVIAIGLAVSAVLTMKA